MEVLVQQVGLPITLFTLMMGMGMSLTLSDFAGVLKYPKPAIIGVLSMLLLVPALGFLVATSFELPPAMAVGVVLVATCPGGMFSNLWTDFAKGNLPLSISLTGVVSAAYVLSIPLWAGLALDHFMSASTELSLPFSQTLKPLLMLLLLPLILGMTIRAKLPTWSQRLAPYCKNIAAVLVLAVFFYVSTSQESDTVARLPALTAAVVTLNLLSVGFALLLSFLFRLNRPDAVAVVLEHGVRQEGTGLYIALTLLGSVEMGLPLLINGGVGGVVALTVFLISRYKRRREQQLQISS